jgi:hypothetical protein
MQVTYLFFIPEDGGGPFLRNVGGLLKKIHGVTTQRIFQQRNVIRHTLLRHQPSDPSLGNDSLIRHTTTEETAGSDFFRAV